MNTIVNAVIASAMYAGTMYVKKAAKGDSFDGFKFGATLIVGAGIGALSYINGWTIGEQEIQTQIVAYAGIVAVVENALKVAYRKVKQWLE